MLGGLSAGRASRLGGWLFGPFAGALVCPPGALVGPPGPLVGPPGALVCPFGGPEGSSLGGSLRCVPGGGAFCVCGGGAFCVCGCLRRSVLRLRRSVLRLRRSVLRLRRSVLRLRRLMRLRARRSLRPARTGRVAPAPAAATTVAVRARRRWIHRSGIGEPRVQCHCREAQARCDRRRADDTFHRHSCVPSWVSIARATGRSRPSRMTWSLFAAGLGCSYRHPSRCP